MAGIPTTTASSTAPAQPSAAQQPTSTPVTSTTALVASALPAPSYPSSTVPAMTSAATKPHVRPPYSLQGQPASRRLLTLLFPLASCCKLRSGPHFPSFDPGVSPYNTPALNNGLPANNPVYLAPPGYVTYSTYQAPTRSELSHVSLFIASPGPSKRHY